jgi:putative ABC transport system permease protein
MSRVGTPFVFRLLLRSLQRRWRKGVAAFLAISAATTLAGATTHLALSIEERVGGTLAAYGANIALVDRGWGAGGVSGYVPQGGLRPLDQDPLRARLALAVPFLYGIAQVDDRPVVVAGTDFELLRSLSSGWEVQGAWTDASDASGAMVGLNAAQKLGIGVGDSLVLKQETRELNLTVRGLVATGGDEENQVFTALAGAQRLLNREGYVSMVQVRARTSEGIEALAQEMEQQMPSVRATTVRQVVEGERHLVSRVVLLLTLVTAGVVVAGTLGVVATTMTAILERRGEVGLMKALGAGNADVFRIFLIEAASVAAMAGLLGGALGFGLAEAVSWTVFDAGVPWRWEPPLVALALAVGMAIAASLPPLRAASVVEPALVLRSE